MPPTCCLDCPLPPSLSLPAWPGLRAPNGAGISGGQLSVIDPRPVLNNGAFSRCLIASGATGLTVGGGGGGCM